MPTVDWSLKENSDRLLAAVWEAIPDRKLDYKRVAQLYGHGATYNSIECRFRPIRKLGEKLRDEAPLAQNGAGTAPSTTSRKPRAPKKDLGKDDTILNGRVNKSKPATSKKQSQPLTIKHEILEDVVQIPSDDSDIANDDNLNGNGTQEPDISEVDAATIDGLSRSADEVEAEQVGAERVELQMGLYGM